MRVRNLSWSSNSNKNNSNNSKDVINKYSYLEFKFLYFKIQEIINKKVVLSLKYEQLKSPEIHLALVKPIVIQILQFGDNKFLASKLNKINSNIPMDYTPRFGATSGRYNNLSTNNYYNSINERKSLKISTSIIFILFLLRYEYSIQSENNLICFELLITKANLCEILAIRMLREYDSFNRINQLFQTPLASDLLAPSKRHRFNTLELSVLSKAKKFLTQPVVIRILDRFYNGELIFRNVVFDDEEQGLITDKEVTNYQYKKISLQEVIHRSNIVPKYQSLVINLRLILFLILYFLIIFWRSQPGTLLNLFQICFWLIAINFNIEFLLKLNFIEFRFMKMIIWNHIDFVLLLLVDLSFILKIAGSTYFEDLFSLIPIVLLPRILSILNNYQFFNLIVSSLSKMALNLVGLICLFFSLISGFYFSFITLSNENQTNSGILFDMVKIFFGFTPSVWLNWEDYNVLGKVMLMAYLFLIQFIVGSILAIVLSGVFLKVHENSYENFNYFKATNLILYFKIAKLNYFIFDNNKSNSIIKKLYQLPVSIIYSIIYILRMPIILVIFIYELFISIIYNKKIMEHQDLKQFTFLSQNQDYYGDDDLVSLIATDQSRKISRFGYENDGEIDDEMNILPTKSRKNSIFKQMSRNHKLDSNFPFNNINYGNKNGFLSGSLQSNDTKLYNTKSISTLGGGNLRSASTDSLFISELLNKRYRDEPVAMAKKERFNDNDSRHNDFNNRKTRTNDVNDINETNDTINQDILERVINLERLIMKQAYEHENDDDIRDEYNSIKEDSNSVIEKYSSNNRDFSLNVRDHKSVINSQDSEDDDLMYSNQMYAILEHSIHEVGLINSETFDEDAGDDNLDDNSEETIEYESDDTF